MAPNPFGRGPERGSCCPSAPRRAPSRPREALLKVQPAPRRARRWARAAHRAPVAPRLGARGYRFAEGLRHREGPVGLQVRGDRALRSPRWGEHRPANLFAFLEDRRTRARRGVDGGAWASPPRGEDLLGESPRRAPPFEGIAEATFRPPAPSLARVLRPDGVVFRCSNPSRHARRGRELRVSVGPGGGGSARSLRYYRLFILIEPWPTPSSLPSGLRKPTARTSTRSRTSWDSPRPT